MKKLLGIGFLVILMAMFLPAWAETVYQVNGQLEPKTQAEMRQMMKEAVDAYFSDAALAAKMKAELRTEKMVLGGEEQTVYILTHDGHSIKFHQIPDGYQIAG